MFSLLHLLSYAGGLAAFLFVTLSLASGLLWLAELIEEHSKYAKVVGMRAIYVIIVFHILLIFSDSMPILPTLLSIIAHLVYLTNFSASWPYMSLTSVKFLASCALVVADHFTWFFHFSARAHEAKRYRGARYRYNSNGRNDEGPVFVDVAAFFAICVWFVPLFLFLSLSANDNALPSFGDSSAPPSPLGDPRSVDRSTPGGTTAIPASHRQLRARTSTSLVKSLLVPLVSLLPRLRSRRKNEEGLIAPRTPIRGSPVHTPVMMPQSYFPWETNGQATGNSPQSGALTPALLRTASRTPPPPRRVQSDAQVNSHVNPRGIATRDGKPVFPDVQLPADEVDGPARRLGLSFGATSAGGNGLGLSSSSSRRGGESASDPPRIGLGQWGGTARAGETDIVEADEPAKHKND